MTMQPNPGHLPPDCVIRDEDGNIMAYQPVHVVLWNGWSSAATGNAPWPAAGRHPATNWRLSQPPHPFEIQAYEVAA